MKTRIVVMSLIFAVAPIIAGCATETDSENRTKQENRSVSQTDEKTVRFELARELAQASNLLKEAEKDLDENSDDSQAKATRMLGYPVFLVGDFNNSQGLVSRLKNPNKRLLSKYLVENFSSASKTLLENSQENDLGEDLLKAITAELNGQIQNKDLYDKSRFPEGLPAGQSQLSISKLSAEQLANLNYALLQQAYSEYIKPAPAESVVHHLEEAAKFSRSLSSPEAQTNIKPKTNQALETTRGYLKKISQSSQKISASDITTVSAIVSDVLSELSAADPSINQSGPSIWSILAEALKYALLIAAVAALIGVIVFFVSRIRRNAVARELATQQAFKKVFERHDMLQQDFTSFKNHNTGEIDLLKDQISRLENAQRIVARQHAQSANQVANTPTINRFYEPQPLPVKEEPEFPVSAETYLRRMQGLDRQGTVIRPDFQNGILVKDADGRGELLLIEDSRTPVDFQRLLVIPSVAQFQMKQDFYNYYDSYYECDQPTAGDVWILHPAVVEKVTGGWRLTEKGRLEVR